MQYTKSMIDLVQEVRRRAPREQKAAIKLANPDVLYEIADLFHGSSDAVLKAVIKELMELAGDPWADLLVKKEGEQVGEKARSLFHAYRGAVSLVDRVAPSDPEAAKSQRKKRVYRGRVVED